MTLEKHLRPKQKTKNHHYSIFDFSMEKDIRKEGLGISDQTLWLCLEMLNLFKIRRINQGGPTLGNWGGHIPLHDHWLSQLGRDDVPANYFCIFILSKSWTQGTEYKKQRWMWAQNGFCISLLHCSGFSSKGAPRTASEGDQKAEVGRGKGTAGRLSVIAKKGLRDRMWLTGHVWPYWLTDQS